MPSTYSSLLRLELMAVGEKTNTWGNTANLNLGTLVEKSIAGAASIDVTLGNVTLTSLSGIDDQARCAILLVTGLPGVARNIVVPASSKTYVVYNGSNAATTIKGAVTAGVALNVGEYAFVAWNGLDFVRIGVSPISPAFLGSPTVPTPAVNNNSTLIANTAYVIAQGYLKATTAATTYAPLTGGGTSGSWPITATGNLPLTGGNLTGGVTSTSDFRTRGQIRATGWRGTGGTDVDGAGAEIGSSSGNALVAGYNRTANAYTSLVIQGASIDLGPQSGNATVNGAVIYTTNNFNPAAYAPLTGVGTSGTWPINISGNAANATSGTYTPTLTNVLNTASSSAEQFQWLRAGSVITVSGKLTIDPTAGGGVSSRVGISLPVASNILLESNVSGIGASYEPAGLNQSFGRIYGDAVNDRAQLGWNSASATTDFWAVQFTYIVQ